MYVMTTEKLSLTINKGQKPGHLCTTKESPCSLDPILKREKEDMSMKTRTYGNPTIVSPIESGLVLPLPYFMQIRHMQQLEGRHAGLTLGYCKLCKDTAG
jgi:hypothetical protein